MSVKLYTTLQKRNSYYFKRVVLFLIPVVVLVPFVQTMVFADSYNWTQTNWNAGVIAGTVTGSVNTYSAQTNINTGVLGEITMANRSDWCNNASCDSTWKYRRKITFDNTTATLGLTADTLTNFPVLVKVNSSRINYSQTKDAGEDIRFTDPDGTALFYQIETWDEAGDSFVWVKVPQIDANSNTDYINMYYGNSAALDSQSPTNVWTENFRAVWNLNDTTQTVADSTVNASNATLGGSGAVAGDDPTSISVDCKSGKCMSFDGGDFIVTPVTAAFGTGGVTVSAWFKAPNANQAGMIWSKRRTSTPFTQVSLMLAANCSGTSGQFISAVDFSARCSTYTTDVADATWHHAVFTRTDSETLLYIDGVLVINHQGGAGNASNTDAFRIGDGNGSLRFNGQIDQLTLSLTSRSAGWSVATYRSDADLFATYDSEVGVYEPTGSITSNIFDTSEPSIWEEINYSTSGTGNISLRVRTSNSSTMSGAPDFSTCDDLATATDLSTNNCSTDSHRYLQYQAVFETTDLGVSPILSEVTIEYSDFDEVVPMTNATNVEVAGYDSGDWLNIEPTITWTDGVDNLGGAGLMGYCVALEEANIDTSANLDPEITAGILGSIDDGVDNPACPYIAVGTELVLNSLSGLNLVTNKQYNFSIKAVDLSRNIWVGDPEDYQDLVSFKYDTVLPTTPGFISMPSNFISTKDVTITWPFGGSDGTAVDTASGIAGLQYRIASDGVWYGDLHTGTEDVNDVLNNDGSYITDATYDYPDLVEGINYIYFRSIDNAGNISAGTVNGVLKLNTVAPSEVQNLESTPSTNTVNSYAFDWDVPAVFTGSVNNITYCYTINVLPSISNCNYTDNGETSLAADAFATQPGTNTIYVVARDEASNINYDTYVTTTFTYNGSAPGIPTGVDIADISVKSSSNWKLALSWSAPSDVGAGVSKYAIYRTTSNLSCSSSFGSFTKIGEVNSTAYIDSGLSQVDYYYCVKACDSANNCSAASTTVTEKPEGKFTEPALLISEPVVTATTTRKAVINWVTDRVSDSKIQYGLSSETYFVEEVSISNPTTSHTIALNNLEPGKTYYYKAKWTDEDGNTGISSEKTFTTDPAPVLKNATPDRVSVDSAVIRFTSVDAVGAKLFYGKNGVFTSLNEINVSSLESTYIIQLTGLEDSTPYIFKINLTDIEGFEYEGDIYTFQTIPRPRISGVQIQELKNSAQPTVEVTWLSNTEITSVISFYPVDNPQFSQDSIDITPTKEHTMKLSGLLASTQYVLTIRGSDALGNEATSSEYFFTTATDTRPPTISNLKVETTLTSSEDENSAQVIVSWETDESATSQVEYSEGLVSSFGQATSVDRNLKRNHTIIISNITPSKVYSLRAISADSNDNRTESPNNVVITPKKSESALEIIIRNMTSIFNFL